MQENKEYTGRFESLIEQFLVFSSVTPVFVLLLYLIQHTIVKVDASEYINWFSFVLIEFSGLFYSFILYIFVKEKTKGGFYICFIVFYILFEGLICFIFRQYNVPYAVIPISIVMFFVQALFNDVYVMHDVFVNHWEGKTGKELETHLYHNNVEAGELGKSIKTFDSALSSISIIYFIILNSMIFGKINFSIPIVLNTILFGVSIFFSFYKSSYFKREAYYANIGFTQLVKNKKQYVKTVWLILIVSCALGYVCSTNNALIKFNFGDKTEQIYEVKPKLIESGPQYEIEKSGEIDLDGMFGEYKESWILHLIFYILKIAFVVFLIITALFYLIKPFFSQGWRAFWHENKLYDYLKKLIEDIKDFFRILFQKDNQTYATVEAKTFRASINEFLKSSKKSKEKKAELDRLTKRFMDLIEWGSRREVEYKKTLAPAEYTKLLQDFADKTALETVGNLFEKALYDKDLLSKDEETEYFNAIKTVMEQTANK